MKFAIKVTPVAAEFLKKLHPDNKKLIKTALKDLTQSPYSGKELQEELAGYLSFKSKRFRIIYKVRDSEKTLYIFFIGQRKEFYELFAELVKSK